MTSLARSSLRLGIGLLLGVALIFLLAMTHEQWAAQYCVDCVSFIRGANLPLLRIVLAFALLSALLGWLYYHYRRQVIAPARQARSELLDSQAFSLAVIESAPAGLIVIRLHDHQVVVENQRAKDSREVAQSIVEMARQPGIELCGEASMVLQGRCYRLSFSSTRYQDQQVLLCAFTDVTEHLERAVALSQAKSMADKASEAKTLFLATMSHEIRTPLYGVLGTLELLGLTGLDQRQMDYLSIIQRSSSTLLQLISDVLDVSRIESGQLTLESVAFSPLGLIEDVMSAHIANARAKGLQIYACVAPEIPDQLVGDEVRIWQILNNLLGNAIKFTDIGRVVLRCRVARGEGQDITLELQVTDTGIGISPEQQLHLFEPFYQARANNLVSGTGLGLSICSRFSALMGGEVKVVSEQGLGSSFTVRLPFVLPDTPLPAEPGIDLGGVQVYVRAPVLELAENIGSWLLRWHATVTVLSAAQHEVHSGALLVEVLGNGKWLPDWNGRRLLCDYDGPQVPEPMEAGWRVSANHVRAIAGAVLMEKNGVTEPAPPGAAPALPALGLQVLVAEDNLINQAILKEQLEALGCTVELASDGQQALQQWRKYRFDVLLTDVNMPVMNGYELARAIRLQNAKAPIIGVTANAMRDEGERCQAAGMTCWVVKPLSLTTLRNLLLNVTPALAHEEAGRQPSLELSVQLAEAESSAAGIVLSPAMRDLFLSTMEKDIRAIRLALAAGEQTDVLHKVHGVSGALSVVQAHVLARLFGELEHRLRAPSLQLTLIDDIHQALDRLCDLMRSV